MKDLDMITYRYYTIDDIGKVSSGSEGEGETETNNYAVYLINTNNDGSTIDEKIINSLNSPATLYTCADGMSSRSNNDSAIFHYYCTSNCNYLIDTIAIFTEVFNTYIDSTKYFCTVLSVGKLEVPMSLSSAKNWDVDLCIAIGNRNTGDLDENNITSRIYHDHACIPLGESDTCHCQFNCYSSYNLNLNYNTICNYQFNPEISCCMCIQNKNGYRSINYSDVLDNIRAVESVCIQGQYKGSGGI